MVTNELGDLVDRISEHCDLNERLASIPMRAQTRGFRFRSLEATMEAAGLEREYRRCFTDRPVLIRWYPTADYVLRIAVAGALLTSPEDVHLGMTEIGRRYCLAFCESVLGRVLLPLASHDPKKLLAQGLLGRRQGSSTGRWTLTFPTERSAIVDMVDEYGFIESELLGAARGTFEAIGLEVDARAELLGPFTGRHVLRW